MLFSAAVPPAARRTHPAGIALVGLFLALAGCKGGGDSPTAPSSPPPGGNTHSVDAVVYYDENGNGQMDGFEVNRIPEATVEVGGRTAQSAALSGEATVAGVPAGTHTASVKPDSLPPYYEAATLLQVSVPTMSRVELPVTLRTGTNLANRYMAFGDSITEGNSREGNFAYRRTLQMMLEGHFGIAEILNNGVGGTTSAQGADRVKFQLFEHDPAIVLIVYGTNDWNSCLEPATCFTVSSLRSMIREVRNKSSWPFVATIPPTNTGFDERAPPSRNVWVRDANELIKAMAAEEGAVVMDVHAALLAGGDLAGLFEDHVHPNPMGYDIMAEAMFEAIARGRVGAAARLPSFGFSSFQ